MDTDEASEPTRDNVIPMPGPGPSLPMPSPDAAETHVDPRSESVAAPKAGEIEPPEAPDLVELLEQAIRVALGIVSTVSAATAEALARSMGRERSATDEHADPTSVALLTGAALGLGFEVGRRALDAAASLTRASRPVWSWTTSPRPVRGPIEAVEARLLALNDDWREARPGAEQAADAFTAALVPQVVTGVLDQIDLTALVRERVDVDALAGDVDLAAIVERIPIDDIVARIDLDRIVERVDVDAVAGRIDIERVVGRLDLAAIANEVIEAVDLPEIIRESSGAMASESIEGLRVQGMNADEVVAKVVDRMLRRRTGRDASARREPERDPAPRKPGDP